VSCPPGQHTTSHLPSVQLRGDKILGKIKIFPELRQVAPPLAVILKDTDNETNSDNNNIDFTFFQQDICLFEWRK
jgi:hypothetical protein